MSEPTPAPWAPYAPRKVFSPPLGRTCLEAICPNVLQRSDVWREVVYYGLASGLVLSLSSWLCKDGGCTIHPHTPSNHVITRRLWSALITAGIWPSPQQPVGSRGLFRCLCCIQLFVWRCTCCRASGHTWCRRQNGPWRARRKLRVNLLSYKGSPVCPEW